MALDVNYLMGKTKKTDEEKKKNEEEAQAIIDKVNSGAYNFGVDEDYINSFLDEVNDYVSDVQGSYQNIGYGTASSIYEDTSQKASALREKETSIRAYLNTHSNISEDSKNSLLTYLDSYKRFSGNVVTNLYRTKSYYSKWDTEDDYNSYLSQMEEREKLLNYDVSSAQAKKAQLEEKYNSLAGGTVSIVSSAMRSRGGLGNTSYNSASEDEKKSLKKQIDSLTQEITLASRLQNAEKLKAEALSASDFREYSKIGANIENPTMQEAEYGIAFGLGTKKVVNKVTYSREHYAELALGEGNGSQNQGSSLYHYMTEQEVSIYNYYLAKEGEEKADEYLDSIEETLNYRQATNMVEAGKDIPAFEVIMSFSAGLDQASSGFQGAVKMVTGDDSYTPVSSTQYASGMVRENLADTGTKLPDWAGGASLGQVAYDLGVNTVAQVPAMIVGTFAGPTAGALTTGVSAGGNAYTEKINLGYSKEQASLYAALTGASEAELSYLLSGIDAVGGKLTGNALNNLSQKLDNAIARVAIQLGGRMASEFTEEYLQEILDPFFENLALGAENEISLISSDAIYSGILGALTAGFLEGPSTVSENVDIYKTGKEIKNSGIAVDGLKSLGETFSADSVAYRLAGKVDENTGAYTIGRLFNEVGAEITAANKADIQKSLERKGIDPKSAEKITETLAAVVAGAELSSAQAEILNSNKDIAKTVMDVIINPNSTVNQRTGKYADLYNLARETAGAKVTENTTQGAQADAGEVIAENATTTSAKKETAFEGEYKVSDGGETFSNVTGEKSEVAKIASIKDGKMTLKLENGEEVDAENVSFGSQDEAIVYETVAKLPDINAEAANLLIKNMDLANVSAEVYAKGIEEAYRFGTYSYPASEMTKEGALTSYLSEQQRMQAYRLGQSSHKAATEAREATIRKNRKVKSTTDQAKKADSKKGKVHFDGDRETLNQRQKTSVEALEKIAEALGVEIYLFESPVVNGKRQGANGWYDPKDGSIHIDIFAGQNGEATMLFTAAHELTHFIKQWSPAKFDVLANFLMEEYGKKGVSVEELVRAQQEKAKRQGREISYDVAFEEVVADSMETMLSDGKVMEKLAKLKAQDKTLWQKIKSYIDELVSKIKAVYEGLKPDSLEGQYVADMVDAAERLQELFTEGLAEAGENFQTIGSIDFENFADAKTVDGEQLFQYRAMEEDESSYRSMLKKWGKFSDAQINNLFSTVDKAMEVIKDNLEILDYAWEADIDDRAFSPVKPNSDSLYQVSIDFSTLCRKRILQQTVQAKLQEALKRPTTKEEGIAIRDALIAVQEEGRQIEVACALCYVESARMKSPPQIEKFLGNRENIIKDFFASKSGGNIKEKIQQAEVAEREKLGVGNESLKHLPKKAANQIRDAKKAAKASYTPTSEEQKLIDAAKDMTVSDFTTPEGLENLAKHYRGLFDAYTSYVRNATKSKGIENDTWWRAGDSERIGDVLIANMNRENGLRSQSWSDFQVIHIMDYIAAVIELSTRNSKMQAYTKVPDYVELMGHTGVMINQSLIPARDYLGSLDYDSTEGIDYKKSLELRDKYHGTVGTICIGIDNNQIKQLFEDMTIDYVIPYHKSGMAAHTRKAMHLPTWTEYELYQSESNLSDVKAEENAEKYGVELLDKSDPDFHKHTSFSEWFDLKEAQQIAKMENTHPSDQAKKKKYGIMYGGYMAMQNAANNYLKLCAQRGLAPVFSHTKADFTGEDNYWKVLIDRKMVDNITGEIIEQKAIQPIFDEAEVLRILNDELERYPKVKADQEYAIRRVTEEFLSGNIKGGMSAEAISKAMQKPVDNVSKTNIVEAGKEIEEIKYSDRDSDGRELSKGQQEYFKDSKVRDENGNLLVMYHGTANGGFFTIFEGDKLSNRTLTSQIGQGFYFTNVKEEAKAYMKNQDIYGKASKGTNPYLHEVYLNITNPLNVKDDIDLDAAKAVYRDGDYDWFFNDGLPAELNNRTINGVKLTKVEVQNTSKEEKASLYVDYLYQAGGTKEVLKNMPKAFKYDKQGGLLEAMKKNLGHDGIVDEFKPGKFQYVAFSSEQIKQVGNKAPTTDPDIRYSGRDYSYEALASKPDMKVTTVDSDVHKNRADVVAEAKKNAAKIGKINTKDGSVSVHVKDIDTDVLLTTASLRHGLDRRLEVNGPVTMKIGEILTNSIRINEMTPSNDNASGSYALIGIAKNSSGQLYVVRSVVNQFSNEVTSVDVLYAINAKTEIEGIKKENQSGDNPQGSRSEDRFLSDSTISIAELLEYVNQYFPDILPEDVLKHFGYTARPEGKLGESVLYQDRESDGLSNRDLLANAFEGVAQNDIEKKKIEEYKAKIELINSEEAHLHEVNEKIKELSFAKGPKDTKQLKELHADATRTANRISTFDKQLLRLEASKPLQDVIDRERRMAYKRAQQKGKQAVAAARQKAAETQREIIQRYQESRRKAVEGREKTALRHKIKGVVNELNQILLHGTKDKHVMIGLQKAVAEALDAVNMDTIGAEERIAKYDVLIAKANDPDVIASLTATKNRIQQQGDNLAEKIAQLKAAYGDIKNSDDPLVANGYDEVIASKIDSVVSTVGNTPLRAMSTQQLEDVYDMYKMVLTRIRGANESFMTAKKETISSLANRVMAEVEHVGGKKLYRLKGAEKIGSFAWNNLKPVYAFERIGSRTFGEVFKNVRAGEDTWAKDVTEAKDFFQEESRKYRYDKWDLKRSYSFTSKTGQNFKLTLPQIMSLYAYSKRKQADKHLELGGFVFDSNIEITEKKNGIPVKYTVNTATAHNISREILSDIIGKLTAEQKAFVDEMQRYLSSTMGEKGNEVSLSMYGVKLFKEENYFPLKSAKQFMFEQNETAGEVKIKNSGFSKETTVNASNPIVLSDFMDVWANHVNDMSMYHAFVLPLEDFNRVFNYKTPTSESMDTESVKQFIQNAYGKEANDYISQLIKDLNGGAVSDPRETTAKRLIANFKKAAVFSSASVVIQQPSAIGRAFAIIDSKYFIGGKVGAKGHKTLWEEVKKYAPVAAIKEMGYFDTNMGRSTVDFITGKEYRSFAEKAKGIFTDSEYRDEVLSKAPALADEITWCSIWNAVKRETKAKNPGLDIRSEEFLNKAGERFTEVITKTQVYDSVLSRSANMRSKSTFMNMWTAFMAEPTTSINMLEDALRQGKRGNKAYARKAIGAVYGSMVLNSVLVSLVYAARDDDEDETFLEKYLSSLATEIIDGINPLTYLPFFKDVWSALQGFDIERADMSLITKLIDAGQSAIKVFSEDTEDMSEEELEAHDKKVVEAIWDVIDNISSLVGIPVKNMRRDINGAINLVETVVKDISGRKSTFGSIADKVGDAVKNALPIIGWMEDESKGDKLYEAIMDGDETYAERLEDGFSSENSRNSAIRTALRDNDPRIREAALARISGDPATYMRIAKEIIADGFSQDDVVKAINAEINAINKGESESSSGSSKATGFFSVDDYIAALEGRDQAAAVAVRSDIINTYIANGKDGEEAEKSFTSSFKSAVWEGYENGELTESQVMAMLTNYAGMDEAEVEIKFEVYEWKATVPGADDITASAIADYNEYAEPAGISKADYYTAWRIYCDTDADVDPTTGEGIAYSKVKKVMPQIDALPLTSEQKTALALCWWAKSTVQKYKTW